MTASEKAQRMKIVAKREPVACEPPAAKLKEPVILDETRDFTASDLKTLASRMQPKAKTPKPPRVIVWQDRACKIENGDFRMSAHGEHDNFKDGMYIRPLSNPIIDMQVINAEKIRLIMKGENAIVHAKTPAEFECLPEVKKPKIKKPKSAPACDAAMAERGRLPDGAEFHTFYNASTQQWKGSLFIDIGVSFQSEASGVFTLLRNLDKQYRTWLAGQAKENQHGPA